MNEKIEAAYEELRSIIDGGSESFTHEDAVQYLKDRLAQPKYGPVAHMNQHGVIHEAGYPWGPTNRLEPLYTTPPQPEQEPVAWLITDEKINSIQVNSIQGLIDRAKYAHMTDIKLRINGQDEWYEADWLRHLTRTTPPQRKPLTDEQITALWETRPYFNDFARAIEAAHGIKE